MNRFHKWERWNRYGEWCFDALLVLGGVATSALIVYLTWKAVPR